MSHLLSSNQICLLTKTNHKYKPKIKTQIETERWHIRQLLIYTNCVLMHTYPTILKNSSKSCDLNPHREFVIQILWKCSLKALLTWHCYHGIHLTHRSEPLSDVVWCGKELEKCLWRGLRQFSICIEQFIVLLSSFLILNWRTIYLSQIIFFSQRWYTSLPLFDR